MAVRTARKVEIPERELVEDRPHNCALDGPPHNFDQGWGINIGEDVHADTVPVLFCVACGCIRLLRIPDEYEA